MSITPISPTTPACYGVCCPQHGECARYHAVEGAANLHVISTCDDDQKHTWPLFAAMEAACASTTGAQR